MSKQIRSVIAWLLASSVLLLGVFVLRDTSMADASRSAEIPTMEALGLEFEIVTEDVSLPTGVVNAGDGSNRLFILQQTGAIRIWDGTAFLDTPFLDVSDLVNCCNERGLLGLAFHPDYGVNGLFYISYTQPGGSTLRVAEYQVSADPNVADPDSARTLFNVEQLNNSHQGGSLQFGPDGYLYIGFGDGEFSFFPGDQAQQLDTLLGKMVRIDPINNNVNDGLPYDIPADNPFVDDPDALDEIWAYGLRNPWKFSFDRATGALLIGDVGQLTYEELNFQSPQSNGGENYGWPRMEATHCFNPSTNCNDGTLKLPVIEYSHAGERCAIIAGYVYRGSAIPAANGIYIYGDYCTGQLWAARYNAETSEVINLPWLTLPMAITAFGEDEAGDIYVAGRRSVNTDVIYKIVNSGE